MTNFFLWYPLMTFLGIAGTIHGVLLKRKPPYTMTEKGNSIPQGAMNPEITTLKVALVGGAPGHLSSSFSFATLVSLLEARVWQVLDQHGGGGQKRVSFHG